MCVMYKIVQLSLLRVLITFTALSIFRAHLLVHETQSRMLFKDESKMANQMSDHQLYG